MITAAGARLTAVSTLLQTVEEALRVILTAGRELNVLASDRDADVNRPAAYRAVLDVRLPTPAVFVHVEGQRLTTVRALGFDVHATSVTLRESQKLTRRRLPPDHLRVECGAVSMRGLNRVTWPEP